MDKQTYLKYFSKYVRWMFPEEEAEDVTADYKELLSAHPEDGTLLVKTLGTPLEAVRKLGRTKEYTAWMVFFTIVSLGCMYFFAGLVARWCLHEKINIVVFYLLVAMVSLWKWKNPKEGKTRCRGLLPALVGLAVFAAVMCGVMWKLFWTMTEYIDLRILELKFSLYLLSGVSFIAGIIGLVKCRMQNRRWVSLCVLAFTILYLCSIIGSVFWGLSDVDAILPYILEYAPISIITGAAGVVWTLC